MDKITNTDGRDSSSTVGAEVEIETRETETGIIKGQAERMDSGYIMGLVAEAMGIHPISYTPKKDSGADKTPTVTEAVRCERGLLGGWGIQIGKHDT